MKTSEPLVVFLCGHAFDILEIVGRVRSLDHNRGFTYHTLTALLIFAIIDAVEK